MTGEEITLCVGNEEEPAESVVDVLADLDLSELEDSPAALAKARAMFHRHANVFASSEDDLGCTDAIKHRINTTDARPVAQPYRTMQRTGNISAINANRVSCRNVQHFASVSR